MFRSILAVLAIFISTSIATATTVAVEDKIQLQATMFSYIDRHLVDGVIPHVLLKKAEVVNLVPTKAHPMIVALGDKVVPERFNRLCSEYGSKGVMLTRLCMQLLTRVWDRESAEPTLIIGDKHGGRNRYDGFLDEILDGEMIFRVEESTARSVYRVGATEIRFQTKAEAHFPVAVSSMVCKYTREVMMELFNQFWSEHVPDIKPTKGYPVDARRFKSEIADAQAQLEIADHLLWRGQ